MDWLTFVVELVKATAWPLASLSIALIFRRQLRYLLGRVRKGKVGPAEFEFEQEVNDLAAKIPSGDVEGGAVPPVIAMAAENPRAAILDAWISLERVLHELAEKNGLRRVHAMAMIQSALDAGLLSRADAALFNDLRILRNQATHDGEFKPSTDSVIQYVFLVQGLKSRIESAINSGRPPG